MEVEHPYSSNETTGAAKLSTVMLFSLTVEVVKVPEHHRAAARALQLPPG
jgi:hypothetical protein